MRDISGTKTMRDLNDIYKIKLTWYLFLEGSTFAIWNLRAWPDCFL